MKTDIIKNGRVTEKASGAMEKNIYVFNVADSANKTEIKKAIFSLYKVKPVKVNVLPISKKNVSFRGQPSTKGGGKKAVVYLKEGDKIEVI
jgi:large subunit ribosomal protein L23